MAQPFQQPLLKTLKPFQPQRTQPLSLPMKPANSWHNRSSPKVLAVTAPSPWAPLTYSARKSETGTDVPSHSLCSVYVFKHLLQAVFQSSLTCLIDVFLPLLLGRVLHKQMNLHVRDFPDGSLRWQVIASSLPISHTAESLSHTDPPSTNLLIALPAVCRFSYFGHHDDMHRLLVNRTLFRLMGKWLVAGELFLLIPWLNGCQYGLKSC